MLQLTLMESLLSGLISTKIEKTSKFRYNYCVPIINNLKVFSMNYSNTIFNQLLNFLPKHKFRQFVAEHETDKPIKMASASHEFHVNKPKNFWLTSNRFNATYFSSFKDGNLASFFFQIKFQLTFTHHPKFYLFYLIIVDN